MTEHVTSKELLPCPFCSQAATVRIGNSYEDHEECCEAQAGQAASFAVVCDFNKGGCGAMGGYMLSEGEAVERWNVRDNRIKDHMRANVRLASENAELRAAHEPKSEYDELHEGTLQADGVHCDNGECWCHCIKCGGSGRQWDNGDMIECDHLTAARAAQPPRVLKRYLIHGFLTPLSENGVPELGLTEIRPDSMHAVYLCSDVDPSPTKGEGQ